MSLIRSKVSINIRIHIQMSLFSVFIKIKLKASIKIKYLKFCKASKTEMIVMEIPIIINKKIAIYKNKIFFIINRMTKKIC